MVEQRFDPDPFVLDVSGWVNSEPIDLADLRGRVVVIEAFQMLCPGCVSHGLPQATRVHQRTSRDDVVVLGLHTVFEHHDVMRPEALEVFLHEYRVTFPVAVDRPGLSGDATPQTMRARPRCCSSTATARCATCGWVPSTTSRSASASAACSPSPWITPPHPELGSSRADYRSHPTRVRQAP